MCRVFKNTIELSTVELYTTKQDRQYKNKVSYSPVPMTIVGVEKE